MWSNEAELDGVGDDVRRDVVDTGEREHPSQFGVRPGVQVLVSHDQGPIGRAELVGPCVVEPQQRLEPPTRSSRNSASVPP